MKKTAHLLIHGIIGQAPEDADPTEFINLANLTSQFEDEKKALGDGITNVLVLFNSPGGNIHEGELMGEFLESLKAKYTVDTKSDGQVGSMATKLFMIGETRTIRKGDNFFIHNPQGTPQGDAKEIEAYMKEMRKVEAKMVKYYTETTGAEEAAVRLLMDKQTDLNSTEAVSMGFATEEAEAIQVDMKMMLNKPTKKTEENPNPSIMNKLQETLANFKKELFAELKIETKSDAEKAAEAKAEMLKEAFPEVDKFTDLEVEDGTISHTGEDAKGAVAFKIVEDKVEKLGAGDYELKNGSTMVIGEDGLIAEIKEPIDEAEKLKAEIAALNEKLKEAEAQKMDAEKIEKVIAEKIKPVLDEAEAQEKVAKELAAIRSHYKVPENKTFIRDENKPSLKERLAAQEETYKTQKSTADKVRESLKM